PAMLVVSGDAAATANNIQTHELLYRLSLVAHVVVTVTNVPLALSFYELLKVVNRRLALLDAFLILVATAVEAGGLLNEFAPLVPWIQMPALISEGSLCLWLLVVGVDAERWTERASAATRMWSTQREALA